MNAAARQSLAAEEHAPLERTSFNYDSMADEVHRPVWYPEMW